MLRFEGLVFLFVTAISCPSNFGNDVRRSARPGALRLHNPWPNEPRIEPETSPNFKPLVRLGFALFLARFPLQLGKNGKGMLGFGDLILLSGKLDALLAGIRIEAETQLL